MGNIANKEPERMKMVSEGMWMVHYRMEEMGIVGYLVYRKPVVRQVSKQMRKM